MHKCLKNEKIPFWVTKSGQNENWIIFFESLDQNYIRRICDYFLHILCWVEVRAKCRIFLTVLCINDQKTTKYRFGLQKGVKFWNGFWIHIRDPQNVYSFIYYFSHKVSRTCRTWGGGMALFPPRGFLYADLGGSYLVRLSFSLLG